MEMGKLAKINQILGKNYKSLREFFIHLSQSPRSKINCVKKIFKRNE